MTLDYWAGYTWSMPLGAQIDYCRGIVLAPRWAERFLRDWAKIEERERLGLMLDNGAFGAWKTKTPLSYEEQVETMRQAIDVIPRPEYVVLPDVVGDPDASWVRAQRAAVDFEDFVADRAAALVLQDGANVENYVAFAQELGALVFIGGAKKLWKMEALAQVREKAPDLRVHVGRISREDALAKACELGAQSFDTTTFLRQQNDNKAIDWKSRFERYVTWQA